ncbi:MAG: copper homeostasis protein CutC [Acidobacteriota bacterium]|nr:copper homeostasis protein CutC [Acidobacteriota bacterium]
MGARVKPVLEVIACTVEDALEAEAGGADRLEVVRDLSVGGLTPAISLVCEILRSVKIPVRVMLREHHGFAVGNKDALVAAAREFAAMGLNGVVLGFVHAGVLDFRSMREVLSAANGLNATLHHAFDALSDPGEAIPLIKRELPEVDRILTRSGGTYVESAGPEITILAGGGLDAEVIRELRASTTLLEFHLGRAAQDADGNVSAARVRALLASI